MTAKPKLGIANQKIVSCPYEKNCRVFERKEKVLARGWVLVDKKMDEITNDTLFKTMLKAYEQLFPNQKIVRVKVVEDEKVKKKKKKKPERDCHEHALRC
jgi:hypothetical protein